MSTSFRREDYIKKKRRELLVKLGVFFFILVLIFVGLIFLSRMDRFRISNVEFSGGLLVSGSDVKKETLDFISGNYFFFFPKNNVFIYSHNKLADFLKEKFKRIDTISIDSLNQKTLQIKITERGMYALWCLPFEDTEKCYFMDDNGVVFSDAPNFSGDAYFKYYGFFATSSSPIGQSYLKSITDFTEINSLIETAKNVGIRPVSLMTKDDGEFDLNLYPEGKVYFNDSQPFSKTAKNLETLIKTLTSTTTDLRIDYIDLRFGNKLFYKLK